MSTTNAIVQRTSQEATRCIEQNDPALTRIFIHLSNAPCNNKGSNILGNDIVVQNNTEFINLGKSIGNNTCLERIALCGCNRTLPGAATTRQFMNGFKRNESINDIAFFPDINFSQENGLGRELMDFYKNNRRLQRITLDRNDLHNGGYRAIISTLRACRNMKTIRIKSIGITDKGMKELVSAVRGNSNLQTLTIIRGHRGPNRIGMRGCNALANLLRDPESKLSHVSLAHNMINDGCVKILAYALRKNKTLRILKLNQNPDITAAGFLALAKVLCNPSSINATYLSNHTLMGLESEGQTMQNIPSILRKWLKMNKRTNMKKIAMGKILCYHKHLSMKPFFEWDLKMLPIAIKWFDTAMSLFKRVDSLQRIRKRKLSSTYEFVRMFPMFFVPVPPKHGRKRKHNMLTRSRNNTIWGLEQNNI